MEEMNADREAGPERAPRRRRRRLWIGGGILLALLALLVAAGFVEPMLRYHPDATFENVTVRPSEIPCHLSSGSLGWHELPLDGYVFHIVGDDPFPAGQTVVGTLRLTNVRGVNPLTADAEFTSAGRTTHFSTGTYIGPSCD